MKLETYQEAKRIRETIQHIQTKILQVEAIRKRENDDDFNLCRELAHTSMITLRDKLEREFSNI